jgi:tRNA(Ile)-lysidine synthase TilS/MesJ
MNTSTICSKCVLPSSFPNIELDENNICNFCNEYEKNKIKNESFVHSQKIPFLDIIEKLKGKFEYDALCCYSGGKDSTYLLKMMREEFDLTVLAFTLDNGFITEQSKKNISLATDKLNIDHIFYRPDPGFMKSMYRSAMLGDLNQNRGVYQTRISDTCLSCISLINTYAAKLALQFKIPMIFAGFTPGQIPKAVIKNNHLFYKQTFDSQKNKLDELSNNASRYFKIPEIEFEIYQMSPYLVYEKSEEAILLAIKELGWSNPENLDGCSTNCSLNAVGNMCHKKKYKFHPYAQELSQLIRSGLLKRHEALEKMEKGVSTAEINKTLHKLEISIEEINERFS